MSCHHLHHRVQLNLQKIISIQIVIHNAKVNSITIDKQREIHLKIYALTFKIRNITRTF